MPLRLPLYTASRGQRPSAPQELCKRSDKRRCSLSVHLQLAIALKSRTLSSVRCTEVQIDCLGFRLRIAWAVSFRNPKNWTPHLRAPQPRCCRASSRIQDLAGGKDKERIRRMEETEPFTTALLSNCAGVMYMANSKNVDPHEGP